MATPSIHALDLDFQGIPEVIASFLVEAGGSRILIETGPESCRPVLLRRLEERQLSPRDIAAVFVTHIHLDHSGGAGWWANREVPVYVHPKGASHLIDPSRLEASARMVYGSKFDSLWGALIPADRRFVHPIEDGKVISIGEISVEAIDTPGHAFHHHAFRIKDCVFTGDAAGIRLPGSDYISVASAPPQFHLEQTLASLDRISSLAPQSLYLTHFGQVLDPAAHLADYREAVEMNAEFVRARLAEGMDGAALQVAYEAFNLEQAFRLGVPFGVWQRYQAANAASMCADGLRLFWEKRLAGA